MVLLCSSGTQESLLISGILRNDESGMKNRVRMFLRMRKQFSLEDTWTSWTCSVQISSLLQHCWPLCRVNVGHGRGSDTWRQAPGGSQNQMPTLSSSSSRDKLQSPTITVNTWAQILPQCATWTQDESLNFFGLRLFFLLNGKNRKCYKDDRRKLPF